MGLGHSPAIVSEGLVFYFDPINTRSYAGTGLTGFNLIDTTATGSLVGGAVYDVANGGSIFLDGVNDYINFATQPISSNNSISISCWVKFATIPSTFTPIIDAGNVGLGTSGYCISFDNTRKIYMAVNNGFTNINFNFNANTWYHITGTAQQATPYGIKVYVNGTEAAIGSSGASNSLTGINPNIRIGSNFVGSITYLNSNIASVSIYNRALSSTEVLQNYNATKKRFSPEENIVRDNLILNLDAGNNISYSGTGTSWFEISGSGSTATLVSTTFSSTNGGAFVFNGSSSYASLPTENRFDLSTGSATIAAWFKTTSTGLNCIASKRNGTGFQLYVLNTKLYADGAGTAGASSSQAVNTGNNFYGAVVYDRANSLMRLYVNGFQDGSVALASTTLTDTADVNVGRKTLSGAGDYFNGTIYQVQIYSRALSSTEILQNYNAAKSRYGLS